jgi:hypothetical protein
MVHGSTRASRAMPLRSPIGLPVILSLLATVVLAAPTPAAAHHSFAAHFQMDTMVEVEGRVTDIQWVNPHIKIHVEDANGQRWEVEAGPVNLLTRMGVSRDKFVIGDRLRVRGNPGRGDERVIWVSNILLSDNTEILANPRAEPYWGSSAVGDASAFFEAGDLSLPEGDKRSFFRVWSPPLEQFPRPRGDPKLTAAGVAAQARYGIDKQVVADCETPGMPFAMVSPYPIELVDRGDRIVIRAEAYDLERVAWLQPPEVAPGPTALGYSLARFDGNTLIVDTTRIHYHSYGDLGPAQSDRSHVVERFTLSDDGLKLDYEVTVTDPEILVEPWLWGGSFIYREGAELKAWKCGASLP